MELNIPTHAVTIRPPKKVVEDDRKPIEWVPQLKSAGLENCCKRTIARLATPTDLVGSELECETCSAVMKRRNDGVWEWHMFRRPARFTGKVDKPPTTAFQVECDVCGWKEIGYTVGSVKLLAKYHECGGEGG